MLEYFIGLDKIVAGSSKVVLIKILILLSFVAELLAAQVRLGGQLCKFYFLFLLSDWFGFIILHVVPAMLRNIVVIICNAGFNVESVLVFFALFDFGQLFAHGTPFQNKLKSFKLN